MPKTVSQCTLCKKVFDTQAEAFDCETSHGSISDYTVNDRAWTQDEEQSIFPDKIEIRDCNGDTAWYRMIPECFHVDYDLVAKRVTELIIQTPIARSSQC